LFNLGASTPFAPTIPDHSTLAKVKRFLPEPYGRYTVVVVVVLNPLLIRLERPMYARHRETTLNHVERARDTAMSGSDQDA
jgi:hypothetical protein